MLATRPRSESGVNLPLRGARSKRTYNDPPSFGHKVCGWAALICSPHLVHSRYAILAIGLIVAALQTALAQILWLQQRCSCYSGIVTQVGLTLHVASFTNRCAPNRFSANLVVAATMLLLQRVRRASPGSRYFFFAAGSGFCSDLGSDRFLGDAFCKAAIIRCPPAGVPTMCCKTISRAVILRP